MRPNNRKLLLGVMTSLLLVVSNLGCGGGKSSTPPQITVTVSPASGTVLASGTAQLVATVDHDLSNKGVTWTLSCPTGSCGSVSPTSTASGAATTYTAPAPPASDLHVTVNATSVADSRALAWATVTVPAITVAGEPDSATVPGNTTAQFTATVSLSGSVPVANIGGPSRSASASSANQSSAGKYATGLSSLPPDAQAPISAALGKDDSGFLVHRSAKGFRGENPRHALVAEFTRQGAEVRSHDLRWGLETRGYGYGDALHPLNVVAPQANANRVEYRRAGVTEWYENGPLGLEQGFALDHPPGKANGQPLTVELGLHGDLVAALEPGEKALELRRNDGEAVLRYTGLKAQDATGRELRSWLEVQGERLLVRVEDWGARYPVVVDPWVQQAELTASDGAANDGFGWSVAVSGSTAVVGAPGHAVGSNAQQGAVYVFVESGGTWSQQAVLTASDGWAGDTFGNSVAVDGSTVVVGAPLHGKGRAYVFVESGGTWSQQAVLTASDGAGGDYFGISVAVCGSTVVVGAPYHTPIGFGYQGAAYVFVESGGTWNQQAELTEFGGKNGGLFGYSVAVSGSTAVVGTPYEQIGSNPGQGVAYVFVQSGTTWSLQQELTASDGGPNNHFGNSVAVSGSTVVVGPAWHNVGSNFGQGAAYVFVGSGGTWSQQAELTASDGAAYDYFGWSVAVDGSTVVVGAICHPGSASSCGQGAAHVFVESGGAWSQQAELAASDGALGDWFGQSVAVSGSTAVVGAPLHAVGSNAQQGAAYVSPSFSEDFTIGASPTTVTIGSPGQSGPTTITITPSGGFNQTITFTGVSCSGLPTGASCSFNPASVTPNGGAASTTLTFATMAASAAIRRWPLGGRQGIFFALAVPGLLVLGAASGRKRGSGWEKAGMVPGVVLVACSLSGLNGCSGSNSNGGGGGGGGGTPAGTYTVTVTATAPSYLSHATSITLVVQ